MVNTVKQVTSDYGTSYNNKRSLARKSNGNLWCVYERIEAGIHQIFTSYSTNGGVTWVEEQVSNAPDDQFCPAVAIDSLDNVHVVWRGWGLGLNPAYGNIQYRKRITTWQAQEAVTDINRTQYNPSIAVDSLNNVHVTWAGSGWGTYPTRISVQYRKRTTTWQTQESVTDINTSQGTSSSIAIDSLDNVHLAWSGRGWGSNPSYLNVQYRKRTTTWQTQEPITDIDENQGRPSIAIDSLDYVHVSWDGLGWGVNDTNFNVQYRKRTITWQTQEPVTDLNAEQGSSSIALDFSDNVCVTWNGKGWGVNTSNWNILYRKKTPAWQTVQSATDRPYDQSFPILIWACCPIVLGLKTNRCKTGLTFVWSGCDVTGYKIEYFASSDLTWETPPPPPVKGAAVVRVLSNARLLSSVRSLASVREIDP